MAQVPYSCRGRRINILVREILISLLRFFIGLGVLRARIWRLCYRDAFLSFLYLLSIILPLFCILFLIGRTDVMDLGICRAAILLVHLGACALRSIAPRSLTFCHWPEIRSHLDSISYFYYLVTWSANATAVSHASFLRVFFVCTRLTFLEIHIASVGRPSRWVFLLFCFCFSSANLRAAMISFRLLIEHSRYTSFSFGFGSYAPEVAQARVGRIWHKGIRLPAPNEWRIRACRFY